MNTLIINNEDIVDGKLSDKILKILQQNSENLTKIEFCFCDSLISLPDDLNFPNLESLDLSNCSNLKSLPKNLIVPKLTTLNLISCSNLEYLSEDLNFANLEFFDLYGCIKLKSFPNFNLKKLKRLNFRNCSDLESLPNFSNFENLKFLTISSSKNLLLLGLADLKNLKDINIKGCTGLILNPDVISQLTILEENFCNITYPDNFEFSILYNEAKKQFDQIIDSYQPLSDMEKISKEDVKELINKYIAKVTKQILFDKELREQSNKIMQKTLKLFGFIKKDLHKNLPWISDICKFYIEKPVTGFFEIEALIEIAKKDALEEKIASAKYLMVAEKVRDEVKTSSPRAKFEDDIEYALLYEVHKELLLKRKILQSWLSIPKKIIFKDIFPRFIDDFKKKGRVEAIVGYYEELNFKKFTQYLLQRQIKDGVWQKIAFAENHEIKAIETACNEKIKQIDGIEGLETKDRDALHNSALTEKQKELNLKTAELTYLAVKDKLSIEDKKEIFGEELVKKFEKEIKKEESKFIKIKEEKMTESPKREEEAKASESRKRSPSPEPRDFKLKLKHERISPRL